MIWRQMASPIRSGFSSASCSTSTLKNRFVRLIRRLSPTFYTKGMACAICETRRPRRFCPGVRGDICSTCCGTEREVTVDCPLDCEYLRDARRFDKPVAIDVEQVPNREVAVTENFLAANEDLCCSWGQTLAVAALHTPGRSTTMRGKLGRL